MTQVRKLFVLLLCLAVGQVLAAQDCIAPVITSVTASTPNCPGDQVTITVDGSLNDATQWVLYTGDCGDTQIATSTDGTFSVQAAATTTYYVTGEGGCVSPGLIWEEQFDGGIPNTWSLASSPVGADWAWTNDGTADDVTIGGSTYTANFYIGTLQMQSPSVANGAAMFNADAYNFNGSFPAAGPFPGPYNSSMTSPTIDCSGLGSVPLKFNQYHRYCCSGDTPTILEVSNDNGATWTNFPINTSLGPNSATPVDDVIQLDISSVAANQSNVKLRFRWAGAGDVGYYWLIDDVQLGEGEERVCVSVVVEEVEECEESEPGAALASNGVNQLVTVPDDASLDIECELSIEFWCKPTAHSIWSAMVMKANGNSWGGGYGIYSRNGVPAFFPTGFGGQHISDYTMPLNEWTHVAATYDGTTSKIYINGSLNSTKTIGAAIPTNNFPLGISGDPGYPSFVFRGELDEVRVWNKALSLSEIQANKDCEIQTTSDCLVGNYHFNQGIGGADNSGVTTLTDASGNGNNGTLGSGYALTGTTSNWVAPGGVTSGQACSGSIVCEPIVSAEPTCPSNIVVNNDAGQCGAVVTFEVKTGEVATPASGSFFPVGTYTVQIAGTSGCGEAATCSFTVTVNDTEAPKFNNCPSNITVNNDTGDCGAEVSWTVPTISDNCTGATSSATDDPGDFFAVGTTTVTYSGSDAADNDAVDCSFTVTVNDTEKPSLSCASNTTIGTDAGECGADVTIPTPNASDNCGVSELKARYRSVDENGDAASSWSSRVTDPSGYFPVGRYQIQWRAKDAAGNKRTCSYYLEVEDDEDPTAVCKDVTVDFNGQSDVNLSVSQVWNESASDDNCGTLHYVGTAPSLNISCEDVGNSFPLTVTIRDEAGNKDQCTATVNVIGLACGWSEGANDGSLNCGSNTSATYDPVNESFDLTANGCWHDCLAPDKAAHVYQLLCGDGQLTARLASINSKGYAGLMARETLDPESRRAGVLKSNSTRRVRREYRASNGGAVTQRPSNRSRVEWLRIVRQGTKIKSYTSTNGSSWRLLYQVTFPGLADCIYVDMMAYSLSGSAEVEATFDQVSITGGGSSYVDNTTLPGSFTQLDTDIELGQAELNIFPNPSRGVSQLELNGFVDAPAQIWVRDAFGKVVRQIEIDAPAGMVLPLDLTALPAGIYLITAMQDQREVVTKKLVLQR